jgi:hypothetical protein
MYWHTIEQHSRISKHDRRWHVVAAGASGPHPFRPGPIKTELRARAAEALANWVRN